MTREESLLGRLINLGEETPKTAQGDIKILMCSITTHLKRLFNTRRGTVLCDLEYGIPDFSNLPGNFKSLETEKIQESIQKAIEKYEPRLKDVEVVFQTSENRDLSINFELSATIYHLDKVIPLRLKSKISSDSKFDLNPLA